MLKYEQNKKDQWTSVRGNSTCHQNKKFGKAARDAQLTNNPIVDR